MKNILNKHTLVKNNVILGVHFLLKKEEFPLRMSHTPIEIPTCFSLWMVYRMFDLSNPNKYLFTKNTTLKGVASQSFGQIPPWELVKKRDY